MEKDIINLCRKPLKKYKDMKKGNGTQLPSINVSKFLLNTGQESFRYTFICTIPNKFKNVYYAVAENIEDIKIIINQYFLMYEKAQQPDYNENINKKKIFSIKPFEDNNYFKLTKGDSLKIINEMNIHFTIAGARNKIDKIRTWLYTRLTIRSELSGKYNKKDLMVNIKCNKDPKKPCNIIIDKNKKDYYHNDIELFSYLSLLAFGETDYNDKIFHPGGS